MILSNISHPPRKSGSLMPQKSLSYKLMLGIMLGMTIVISLLIVVFMYAIDVLEHDLMEKHNQAEFIEITRRLGDDPHYTLPRTAILAIYDQHADADNMPNYLRDLPIGFSDEINTSGHTYYVLIDKYLDRVLYVVYDISEFEASERVFGIIVVASWLTLLALIFVLSYLMSRYMLKPISDFANEIDQLEPEVRGQQFVDKYRGLEVGKMARAVDRYLNKIDEYVEKQHSFAAMASHELRTPLTVVQTSSELISSQTDDQLILAQCEKISRATHSMNDMILALLSITRDLPQDAQEIGPVVLADSIADVLHNLEPQIRIGRIQVDNRVAPDACINSRSTLLSVVINNLLTNAIKHSLGDTIQISFADNRLEILDQGEGLGTANIDELFQKGVSRKNSGGYGLGLYITKLICDHQGWQLELQNANPGTCAKVTFESS